MNKLYLVIFGVIIFASCRNNPDDKAESNDALKSDLVELTAEEVTKHNITTGKAAIKTVNKYIKARGKVELPPDHISKISIPLPGKVDDLKVIPGDYLKKGSGLFMIESIAFLEIQKEFLDLKSRITFMEKDYERQKRLSEENVSARKIFEKTESDYITLLSEYRSIEKILKLCHMQPEAINENNLQHRYQVIADISGYVSDFDITNGTYLNPEDIVMEILDYAYLQAEVYVFEKDIAGIDTGQHVIFKVAGSDQQELKARIVRIGRSVNSENKTFTVTCQLMGKYSNLRHGMNLAANIIVSSEEKLILSNMAAIRDGEDYFVYEKINEKQYHRIKIDIHSWEEEYFVLVDKKLQDRHFVTGNVFYLESKR